MKAIVATDKAAGAAGMTLVERPRPEARLTMLSFRFMRRVCSDRADVALDLDRSPRP